MKGEMAGTRVNVLLTNVLLIPIASATYIHSVKLVKLVKLMLGTSALKLGGAGGVC
jgi:hypothetical protein